MTSGGDPTGSPCNPVHHATPTPTSQRRSAAEFGDPNLLALQGGVVIPGPEGTALGGIGVSGLTAEEDEQIAKVGLQAITSR